MVVSQNEGTQCRPKTTVVLVLGTPKKVALILGKSHFLIILFSLNIYLNPQSM